MFKSIEIPKKKSEDSIHPHEEHHENERYKLQLQFTKSLTLKIIANNLRILNMMIFIYLTFNLLDTSIADMIQKIFEGNG